MSEIDLKRLAMDIEDGKVFTSLHLKDQLDMLGSVFMPLMFGALEISEDIGMIYEYLEKAGPSSINGFPVFISYRMLDRAQTKEMIKHVQRYRELKKNF